MLKQDVEQLLRDGHTVEVPPQGTSMYPFLIEGRDRVVIAPWEGTARWGDVVLFRRVDGPLVLHRVVKVRPEGLSFVGDNQREVEGPLPPAQMRGILVGYVRSGKRHTTAFLPYRVLTSLWLLALPLRPAVWKGLAWVRRRRRPSLP